MSVDIPAKIVAQNGVCITQKGLENWIWAPELARMDGIFINQNRGLSKNGGEKKWLYNNVEQTCSGYVAIHIAQNGQKSETQPIKKDI